MPRPRGAFAGQSLVEYSLIIAFVCLGCIAGLSYLRSGAERSFERHGVTLGEPTFAAYNYTPAPLTPTATATRVPVGSGGGAGGGGITVGTGDETATPPTGGQPAPTATTASAPTATAAPPTATTATTSVTVSARINGSAGSTQETQYWVQLNNTGATARTGMSARVYVDLSEVYAAGLSASNVTTTEYWDQCGTAQLGPVTAWDVARRLYYVQISWQGQSFQPNGSCQVQFTVRMANWQTAWNGANDHSFQGLSTGGMATTTNIPAYRNGARVYGVEP